MGFQKFHFLCSSSAPSSPFDYRTTVTRGHLSTYFLDSILFEYVASLTFRGFRRTTISNRSINPNGAITYSSPSLRNRTATDVAVSGHVATASSTESSGSSGCPNSRSNHRWTPAWLVTSHGTLGEAAASCCWIS